MIEPTIQDLQEQPYVGIRRTVTMSTIGDVADKIPLLIGWLADRNIAPAGAPFLRYHRIDMDHELEIDAGVPVTASDRDDVIAHEAKLDVGGREAHILTDVLPKGRYAVHTHVGPFDDLVGVTGELLAWADARGLEWDASEASDGTSGTVWGCRVEAFLTKPTPHADPNDNRTELRFRLADD